MKRFSEYFDFIIRGAIMFVLLFALLPLRLLERLVYKYGR
jgi:hypothetical protein